MHTRPSLPRSTGSPTPTAVGTLAVPRAAPSHGTFENGASDDPNAPPSAYGFGHKQRSAQAAAPRISTGHSICISPLEVMRDWHHATAGTPSHATPTSLHLTQTAGPRVGPATPPSYTSSPLGYAGGRGNRRQPLADPRNVKAAAFGKCRRPANAPGTNADKIEEGRPLEIRWSTPQTRLPALAGRPSKP